MDFIFLQSAGGDINTMILLGLMFLVAYFFLIRPQQRKQKQQNQFVDELSKGDKVVTTSGIHGKIMEISEGTVVLQVDKNKGVNIRIQSLAVSKEMSETHYGGSEE